MRAVNDVEVDCQRHGHAEAGSRVSYLVLHVGGWVGRHLTDIRQVGFGAVDVTKLRHGF